MKKTFEDEVARKKDLEDGINEVIAGLIKSQERAKSIVADTSYMLWLENFTNSIPIFSDDSWLYHPDEISKEDAEKVNDLCSFFNGISAYAERNFLPIYSKDYTSYVCIKFNNIGYEIGLVSGQGTYAYCQRVEVSSDRVFIDFNDIVANKKQTHVEQVTKTLDKISLLIEQLLICDIPVEAISTRIQDTINKFSKE